MSTNYYYRNRESIIRKNSSYHKERLTNDINYKLRYYVRNRVYLVLKIAGINPIIKPFNLVGCGIETLKEHLQKQFTTGMTWHNYGEWHVDHIKPCASFDLTDLEQQKLCFHYTNLQPLWAEDNLKKNAYY